MTTMSWALVSAVFVASLLGSLHCAGMCGAFVALASGSSSAGGWRGAAMTQSAYHVGRLMTYTLLGFAAGAAGSLLNLTSTLAGIRPIAAAVAGATIAAFGIVSILRLGGVQVATLRLPASWTRAVARVNSTAMRRPPVVRAMMIGLFTTLLPCGWLYAFAITAAGTAHPITGAITMIVFWTGTLPALAAVGVGTRSVLGPIGRRLPVATSIALVIIGLYTLTGRTLIDPASVAAKVSTTSDKHACCTGANHDR